MRAVVWARDGACLDDGLDGLPILLVTPVARLNFPVHDTPARLEDGRMDQGLGLASVRLIEDAGRAVIETPLARVEGMARPAAPQNPAAVPAGLNLGKSYALGAMLLPAGMLA